MTDKSKKEKALSILEQYDVIEALQWITTSPPIRIRKIAKNVHFLKSGDYQGQSIERGMGFDFKGNSYKTLLCGRDSKEEPPPKYFLECNNEIVFQSKREHWTILVETMEVLKLKEWVKDIPLLKKQCNKIFLESLRRQVEEEKEKRIKTEENFDLGDFDK